MSAVQFDEPEPGASSAATFYLAIDPTVIVSERFGDFGRTNCAIAHVPIYHEIGVSTTPNVSSAPDDRPRAGGTSGRLRGGESKHGGSCNLAIANVQRLLRRARADGGARYVDAGENRWSTVHVNDLALGYAAVLESDAAGVFHAAEAAPGVDGRVVRRGRDAAGRYFASFVVQTTQDVPLPPLDSEIGIDLGLTHFAVMSDGTKVTAPRSCAGRPANSNGCSRICPARPRAVTAARRPSCRSLALMRGWPTPAATGSTSCPRR